MPARKKKYAIGPKDRIQINTPEIQEQVSAIVKAFRQFPVSIRKKHIGAALRRACTGANQRGGQAEKQYRGRIQAGSLAYCYEVEARKYNKTEMKRGSRYKEYTRKNGKKYSRKVQGNLRKSVMCSKMFPGFPTDYAVSCKIGYGRGGAKKGQAALLIDEGTVDRYRKVDLAKSDDFAQKARARRSLRGNLILSGKKKGQYKNKKMAQVKPVRRIKAGDKIDAKQSARGFELNSKVQRGISSKKRSGPPGYTGRMPRSPLQASAFRAISAKSNNLLPKELIKALEAASKEVCSGKFQEVMKKYHAKYGRGRMIKQMNSPYGFFSSRIK